MEQRNVIIQIPVKEHTVDYNRLIEYLNKTYCRKYSISQQTGTTPLVSGSVCDHNYYALEEPMISRFTHQCSKCGKVKAN
jgi:hypothetical protein